MGSDGGKSGEEGQLSRRQVIGLLTGTAAAMAGCVPPRQQPPPPPPPSPPPPPPPPPPPVWAQPMVLRRREDLMRIGVTFHGLVLVKEGGVRLLRRFGPTPAYVVFDLGPQSVVEAAFHEDAATPAVLDPPPVGARIAEPTRLAFEVDGDLPLDLHGLLDWLSPRLQPSVADIVHDPGAGGLTGFPPAPRETETAIEIPWRLVLSPGAERWGHRIDPAEVGGRHELWHTELQGRIFHVAGGEVRLRPTVRAVHTPDGTLTGADADRRGSDGSTGTGKPFPYMSLGPWERREIVRNSTGTAAPAIVARRLRLSALGAWTDLEGNWPGHHLSYFGHRGTMGREHFVKVVEQGWLFPHGHQAAKVTITERKFGRADGGPRGAYLHQRTFLVIGQRERRYAGGDANAFATLGRDLPFTHLECTTETTPDITEEAIDGVAGAFVPLLGDEPLAIGFVGTDWAGRRIGFAAPVAFVPRATGPSGLMKVADAFRSPTRPAALAAVAVRPMPGDPIAIADPPADGDPGATSVAVSTLTFGVSMSGDLAEVTAMLADGLTPFYPTMAEATGHLPQAQGLTGTGAGVTARYDAGFLSGGFDAANTGQVFAELEGAAIDFAGDTATGLVNGVFLPTGLSRTAGAVAGELDELRAGKFTSAASVGAFGANLLGVVGLDELVDIPDVLPAPSIDLPPPPDAMTITQRRTDTAVDTHMHWEPKLTQPPLPILKIDHPNPSRLVLDVRSRTVFADPAASTFEVTGELTNVRLDIVGEPGFLVLDIRRVAFSSGTGRKPAVDVDVADVTFGEALRFVEQLASYISAGGLGPTIDPRPDGVEVTYASSLPSIQVGIFTMQNLSFGIGAFIPFDDEELRIRADFASRDNPFTLTVSMFGGGGWASLLVGAGGVQELDIGLEFGASVALDIGIASGGVSLTAGVYLSSRDTGGTQVLELTGFVRLFGEIEVLGLINVTVEFYMALTYVSEGNKVHGVATLTVAVEVFCISKSVQLTAERYFSSSPDDPTFAHLLPTSGDWRQYCGAFAPLEAA